MMSLPSATIVPVERFTIPQVMLMSVVLPAPFGPSSAKISPFMMSSDNGFSAWTPDLYVFETSLIVMIGCMRLGWVAAGGPDIGA
jgi:hypothetical protein